MYRVAPWVLLAGCAGSEVAFSSLVPELAVLPEALDYGEVVASVETPALDVYVNNVGLADLVVDLSVEGEGAAAFTFLEGHFEVAPDGSITVPVTFAPSDLVPYVADLVVASNDPDQALWVVPLTGLGRVPYAPDIEIRPATGIDFGTVDPGDDDIGFVEIANVGDADLLLGSITQAGAGTFDLQTDPSGAVVAPGQTRAVLVNYAPIQPNGDSGSVVVPSNDLDEPVVVVPLSANGGGVFDYPEALFDCPGAVDLAAPVVVHFDGTGSTDPLGGTLSYVWELVRRPLGTDPTRTLVPSDQAEADLLLDAAGTWEVTLSVTSDLGVPSVPTKCVIEAIPVDALRVELSWDGPTSDLDLHLARDGAGLFDVPGDACFCNPNPDWATTGVSTDDPRLDLDDALGYGPENLSIESPADGAYLLRVHHFDDGDDGLVTANVSVFTNGVLSWSGSKVLSRNDVWDAGQVNWPEGTFGVLTDPPWDAEGTRNCP